MSRTKIIMLLCDGLSSWAFHVIIILEADVICNAHVDNNHAPVWRITVMGISCVAIIF